MEPGIIPCVMGGIGNQMFITVAAYIVSKEKECPLYILNNPIENNKHNHTKNDYNTSIFKYFGKHFNLPVTSRQILLQLGYTEFNQGSAFQAWDPSDVKVGTFMTSYYQYYPPIAKFEQEIRSLFLQGLEQYTIKVSSIFGNFENTAFLHVRRGDYLNHPNFHYIQTIEDYYKPALDSLLMTSNPTRIFILSDDIGWVNSQPFFTENPLFKVVDLPNELDGLALMASCTAGAICANSTFSWWGAFLGAYRNRNPVFIPKRWIGEPIICLFPEEWKSI
jgi:hypothetical protein